MAQNLHALRSGYTAATGWSERAEILEHIPFFAGLLEEQRDALAEVVTLVEYRKNQVLFVEGQPSRLFYFIRSGRVKVYRLSSDGRELILHVLGDGDPVAVVPFFDRSG